MPTCKICGNYLIPKKIGEKDVLYCQICNKTFDNKDTTNLLGNDESRWQPNMANYSGEYEGYYYDEVDGCYYEGTRNESIMNSKIENAKKGNVTVAQNNETNISNIQQVIPQNNTYFLEGKCPNCGAILKVDPQKEAAICEYCGTPYIAKQAIQNYYVNVNNSTTNNINANVVNLVGHNPQSQFTGTFDKKLCVKPDFNETEFRRKVLIGLSSITDTPRNISNIQLMNVKMVYIDVLEAKVNLKMHYTCTVGYDYEVIRKVPVQKGNSYVIQEKKETQTDWKPFEGNVENSAYGCTCLAGLGKFEFSEWRLKAVIPEDNGRNYEEKKLETPKTVASRDIDRVKNRAMSTLWSEIKTKLPGDRHKDDNYNGSGTIEKAAITSLPFYLAEYVYNGIKYSIGMFACTAYRNRYDLIYDKIPKDTEVLLDRINDKTIGTKIVKYIFGILYWPVMAILIILALIFAFSGKWNPMPVYISTFILGPVSFVFALTFFLVHEKNYKTVFLKITKNRANEKIDSLNKNLEKNKLKTISPAEKLDALKNLKYQDAQLLANQKGKKAYLGLTSFTLIIVLVIGVIFCVNSASKIKHSPEGIDVSLESITYNEYNEEFVFTYQFTGIKTGISNIEFNHIIFDKTSGTTSKFHVSGDIGINKNQSKIVEATVTSQTLSTFNYTHPAYMYTHKIEIVSGYFGNQTYKMTNSDTKYINNIIVLEWDEDE